MKRLLRILLLPAVMAGLGLSAGQALAHGDHWGWRGWHFGGPEGCPPYWCDPYANLAPWPYDNPLIEGPRIWAWWYPDGGFTAYPGQAGSGVQARSDYSHVNWVVPPHVNAQSVLQRLEALGVPLVPQETMYLGKNPSVNKAKLPVPGRWARDKEPEKDKEKEKEMDKDKDKELNR
jgi:hypothetical protein